MNIIQTNNNNINQNKLPSIFISHGSIGETLNQTGDYYKQLIRFSQENNLLERVETIILISGHWEQKTITINTNEFSKIRQDDHPCKELYKYQFKLQTDLKLADEIKNKLKQNNIDVKTTTREEQIDHGAWGGLFSLFDINKQQEQYNLNKSQYIPKIVSISQNSNLDINDHYKLGQILDTFRNDKVMILTSGSTSHSFKYFWHEQFYQWSQLWEQWLEESFNNKDFKQREQLILNAHKQQLFKFVQDNHYDHFIPLIISFGTSQNIPQIIAQAVHMNIAIQTSYAFI